jgi:hypothetical protein
MESDYSYLQKFNESFLSSLNQENPGSNGDSSSFVIMNEPMEPLASPRNANVNANDGINYDANLNINTKSANKIEQQQQQQQQQSVIDDFDTSLFTNIVQDNPQVLERAKDDIAKNDNLKNVINYMTQQNNTLATPSKLDDKKYLNRLIIYLMKKNPVVKTIFEEMEVDNFDFNEITKFTKIIVNANKVIDMDSTSKYQLTLIYNSVFAMFNTLASEIPQFKHPWNSLAETIKKHYEHCLNKDYQVTQLNYLANCGSLDDNITDSKKITPFSRTLDFFEELIIPVSLSLTEVVVNGGLKVYKEYINAATVEGTVIESIKKRKL